MALGNILQSEFSSTIRSRGQQYFRERRVLHVHSSGLRENFVVKGSEPYRASIEYDPPTKSLKIECSCPYFQNEGLCKHLWATILRCDELRLFSQLNPKNELSLILPTASWNDEEDDEYEDSEDDKRAAPASKKLRSNNWKTQIETALQSNAATAQPKISWRSLQSSTYKRVTYVLQLREAIIDNSIVLKFFVQERLKNGNLGVLKSYDLSRHDIPYLEDKFDQDLLTEFFGKADTVSTDYLYSHMRSRASSAVVLEDSSALETLLRLSAANKLSIAKSSPYASRDEIRPLKVLSENWNLELHLTKIDDAFYLRGELSDGVNARPITEIIGTTTSLVFFEDFCAPSNIEQFSNWVELFDKRQSVAIPQNEIDSFLELTLGNSNVPKINLPQEIRFDEARDVTPVVVCKFADDLSSPALTAQLFFSYGAHEVPSNRTSPEIYDIAGKKKLKRNLTIEKEALTKFSSLTRPATDISPYRSEAERYVTQAQLISTFEQMLAFGWKVFLRRLPLRSGSEFTPHISSGVDWFDINADLKFDGIVVSLPEVLKQIRAGENFIQLKDGSQGLIPEKWKTQLQPLAKIGELTSSGVRLSKIQFLFMNSILFEIPEFADGKKATSISRMLQNLNRPKAVMPPKSFSGKLRPYQAEGLGWLASLSREQMGGILADDMGLGKTVQVLALLALEKSRLPNLVVAPKSLVFNWASEAKRFLPKCKVLSYVGAKRQHMLDDISSQQLIITTYQTLRSDIELFQKIKFGTIIFDEAHFIKNSKSQAFKSCRLLSAEKRFSLTGTPVENSVGDLLSLLSVTLPGLLSESQKASWSSLADQESIRVLAKAVSPFILRRTKDKVLKDLPEKNEQILFCELSTEERANYDQLKKFYWAQLSGAIEENGLAKSKIQILEALLRLRQASCHFGLIDKVTKMSSKFELLLEQLSSVIQEGHKVLIFSQFTSLLELLKVHLHERQIRFEYLDGKTQDRQTIVERFQKDPASQLFLLSLKAGGVGLNLTAADYVYILDPWWNPAAESQAIDRAHRIGQNKKVFAYKIIARDTIEEKILELQSSKKKLAQDLISGDSGLARNLKLEDLKMLFE